MHVLTKNGHTVRTSAASEAVTLRAQGYKDASQEPEATDEPLAVTQELTLEVSPETFEY